MAIISPLREDLVFIQELPGFAGNDSNIKVQLLRLDRIHPLISGNKWYKLRYNLEAALALGAATVITFGGAYSNHLVATAAAASAAGLPSVGIVRGWHAAAPNPVLQQCAAYGMQLQIVSREEYDRKEDPAYLAALSARYSSAYIIPEGGANEAGRRGIAAIAAMIPSTITHVCVSVGSGTTFAGLRHALDPGQQLLGFAPMKGGAYLKDTIQSWLGPGPQGTWEITDRFHFGGFGKITAELRAYMADFEQAYGFPLDRVYTAKMMQGLSVLLAEAAFPAGASILAIHTGGLSGN